MVRWSCRIILTVVTSAALLTFFLSFFFKTFWNASPMTSLQPTSKDLYKLISPSSYKYVLNQPDKCRERSPFLVLMVPVAPGDRASRDVIRKTWGQKDQITNIEILCLFFAGLPTGKDSHHVQMDLESEALQHADIVQLDFLDSYHNLTIKTVMMMNWLASNCRRASYAMKVDADTFLNVHCLVGKLLIHNQSSVKQNYITGSVISDGHPRRDRGSRWYISEDVYPASWFPPYVSGAGYVFSVDLAEKILWASKFAPPVSLEDVYVGLCLRILGIKPTYAFSFTSFHNLFEIRHIEYERCTYFRRVLVIGFHPSELLQVWPDFQKAKFTC